MRASQVNIYRAAFDACSASPPELDDLPAIAFRRSAGRQLFKLPHRFTLRCHLQTQLAAGLGLAVEGLCNRGGAAHIAEKQDLHLEVATVVGHAQHVANPDLARGFGRLPVELNPAEFTSACRQCSRLEESRGPKPLIHSYAGQVHLPFTAAFSRPSAVFSAISRPNTLKPTDNQGRAATRNGQ